MNSMRALYTSLAAAGLALAPTVAQACPSCVGNTQYAHSQLLMLAGFTLLPFTIVLSVGLLIRRAGRDDL